VSVWGNRKISRNAQVVNWRTRYSDKVVLQGSIPWLCLWIVWPPVVAARLINGKREGSTP
jgi:hypothetical protein